uniref:Uncharacterized protein n=1 Tax=Glossina austeni TaxID=7395 RepID=A0A1A9VLB6_GLOAU
MNQNPQKQNVSSQKSDVKIKVFTIILLSYMSQQKVKTSCTSLGLMEQNRCKFNLHFGGPGQRLHDLSRFIERIEFECFHLTLFSTKKSTLKRTKLHSIIDGLANGIRAQIQSFSSQYTHTHGVKNLEQSSSQFQTATPSSYRD